jgi:hypothetical protein
MRVCTGLNWLILRIGDGVFASNLKKIRVVQLMANFLTQSYNQLTQRATVQRNKCIGSVIFQNGGSYVLAVDAGRERILSVWQWQWGHLLGKVAVSWQPCVPVTVALCQR